MVGESKRQNLAGKVRGRAVFQKKLRDNSNKVANKGSCLNYEKNQAVKWLWLEKTVARRCRAKRFHHEVGRSQKIAAWSCKNKVTHTTAGSEGKLRDTQVLKFSIKLQ